MFMMMEIIQKEGGEVKMQEWKKQQVLDTKAREGAENTYKGSGFMEEK